MNSPFRLPNQERTPAKSLSLKTVAAFATATAFATPSSLFGFWEVARGELVLNTTVAGTYDSNVFAQDDAQDDFYFSLIPELQFLRKAGLGTIDARAGVDLTRFLDITSENYEDFFASIDIGYPVSPNSPLSGGFNAAYKERSGINDYLNTRVNETHMSVGLDSLYRFSERLALRNSLSYSENETESFSDVEEYSGTLGVEWFYSPALSYFTDYRIRRAQSSGDDPNFEGDVDNLDHAFFVGAKGTLMPRLIGSASVGYQHSDARGNGEDAGMFVTAAGLEWIYRPQTSFHLTLTRDLDVSPGDETVEETALSLGVDHRIEPKIELTAFIGYRDLEYRSGSSRKDDAFQTGAGIIYTLTRYWEAGMDYAFTYNDSNQSSRDYRRHLVKLYTRYTF